MSRPRLSGLYDLLACPVCQCAVVRRDDVLVCARCRRRYPIVDGIPVLLPPGSDALGPDAALPLRGGYDDWIHRTVLESLPADAVILEIGAGQMAASRPNVIRMDVTQTPHVDIVGDAHALPFLSKRYDFILSLAVLEHLREPFAAAREMLRVLRNGGYVYAECSFVFPFHGHPHHYFNASHLGMEELFRDFTSLRTGVAPHQMPSFAMRALLETYLFFLRPHPDADAQRLAGRIGAVLAEDLTAFDGRFSQEAARRCAACTYFFGVKRPDATEVIPAAILQAHGRSPELQQRFPRPLDIAAADNLLVWGRSGEGRRDPALAAQLDGVVPFHKDAPSSAALPRRAALRPGEWLARGRRAAAAARLRLGRLARSANGTGRAWTVEQIIDDGERVTHLFPNDCFVAHRSIYHFVVPLIGGATVLDAGCGAGYGAAYLAERGARAVAGVDASRKAIEFSRQHFSRPNLRYELMDVERLQDFEPGTWDVVLCSNVLEHVPDVGCFLRGVWTLLNPRGVLVVAVPPIVNDALRAQNLANPYHVNIWSPRQWAHALGRFFGEVQAFQHWYDKPGVELNLINSPADTVIQEQDFLFHPVAVDELHELPTISAVFTARRPIAADRLPADGAPMGFVDDSFTRAGPAAPRGRLFSRFF